MLKKFTVLVALLTAMSTLTACGNDEGDQSQQQTHTALNGDKFSDSDVGFATDMIPHHAQATQMVNMTMGRRLDPEVQKLAEGVRTAQVAEIETMVGWSAG